MVDTFLPTMKGIRLVIKRTEKVGAIINQTKGATIPKSTNSQKTRIESLEYANEITLLTTEVRNSTLHARLFSDGGIQIRCVTCPIRSQVSLKSQPAYDICGGQILSFENGKLLGR